MFFLPLEEILPELPEEAAEITEDEKEEIKKAIEQVTKAFYLVMSG